MRRILLILLTVVILVVGVAAAVVSMQPNEFSITRSALMAAPPAAVFEQVNDFHKWQAWSPWAKLDPTAKNSFSGPDSGKGTKFTWDGNSDVGAGYMTITESRPNELILIDLTFTKPMEGTNLTEFKFEPQGNQTKVTWTMSGKSGFISKAVCMVMDMQKMVGPKFEEGLASIKKIVEAEPKPTL